MDDKYTILIVDDVIENIDVLNGILIDDYDYDLKAATSGIIALKIVKKYKPDLILLDVMMPGMDGYEVCRKLKSDLITKDIPVMFVTAKDEVIDEAMGFHVGAVDYISKPVNAIIVKARVATHLALANQRRELERIVAERTKELLNAQYEIIQVLGRASEYNDNETGLHIKRVSEYCYIVAKAMGISEFDAAIIRDAAPMHDVGKIGVTDYILKKPGKLNAEEWDEMKEHTSIGANILGNHNSDLLVLAKQIALEHHEKVDGNGYPNHLTDEQISIQGKIVALCDVFDALTSRRPYKEPWPIEKALKHIHDESSKHFDSEVVKAFENSIEAILKVYALYRE